MFGRGGRHPKVLRATISRLFAVTLGILGLLGLGFAAALQWDGSWLGTFQAGALFTELDCQPEGRPLVVGIGAVAFHPTAEHPFAPETVEFSGVSPQCLGHDYQVAYRADSDWIPLASGTVMGSTISAPLPERVGSAEFAVSFSRE